MSQSNQHQAAASDQAPDPGTDQPFRLGDWLVEASGNRLQRNGERVRVEPKVMRVLLFLVAHRGRVVTRQQLEAGVWPGVIVTDDAVTNSIIKLRKALGDKAREPRYIETIAKSGYRLIAEVAELQAAGDTVGAGTAAGPADAAGGETGSSATAAGRRGPYLAALAGVALALAAVAVWLLARPPGAPPTPGTPVVAVLPFANLSADPGQDYFADGITDDLITDLSKLSGMRVVARNTVHAYRDSVLPDSRIGRELGARYIVNGSVQRAGDRVRINVQLTDAVADTNRWGERYDRDLSDIFRLQDEIAAKVVSALQVELAPGEQRRLTRDYATSVDAYDAYLRGIDLLGRRSGTDITQAKLYLERAIALEPGFAPALAALAQSYSLDAVYGLGGGAKESLARAEALVRQAAAIDANLPQLPFVMGQVELHRGDVSAAIDQIGRAIELRPSYADAYAMMAWILHFAGRPEEGLEAMRRAIALNPRVPAIYRMVQGALNYQIGRIDEAAGLLQQSIAISPNQMLARLFLAAAYASRREFDAAAWEIEEMRVLDAGFTLRTLEHGFPIRDPAYRQRLSRDLRQAGLD